MRLLTNAFKYPFFQNKRCALHTYKHTPQSYRCKQTKRRLNKGRFCLPVRCFAAVTARKPATGGSWLDCEAATRGASGAGAPESKAQGRRWGKLYSPSILPFP